MIDAIQKIDGEKKKRGRPPTGHVLVGLRMLPHLYGQVCRWADRQPDAPSLSEAIRRLIERGLEVAS